MAKSRKIPSDQRLTIAIAMAHGAAALAFPTRHPLARTRDGPSLDGRGTTGRTEDLLETKRGISKATRNYRYKKKESLAASRLMSSRSSREGATYEHIFYELRLDHEFVLSRSGRALSADSREERNDIQTAGREGEGLFFLYR
jgi:hypothetical protein